MSKILFIFIQELDLQPADVESKFASFLRGNEVTGLPILSALESEEELAPILFELSFLERAIFRKLLQQRKYTEATFFMVILKKYQD